MGGWQKERVCPACISETVRCRKLILGRDISWGGGVGGGVCRCAMSLCDLDLTLDLALCLKILSRLYLGNHVRHRKFILDKEIG